MMVVFQDQRPVMNGLVRSLPNALTLARIGLGLGLAPAVLWPGGPYWWWALALFTIAALTDRMDGLLARAWQCETAFGRALDPLADKIVVMVAMLVLILAGVIAGLNGLAVILILAREFLITGCRDMLAAQGRILPVSRLAKWKTASQMIALGILIIGAGTGWTGVILFGLCLLWLAAGLSLWTGAQYVRDLMTPHEKGRAPGNERTGL